MAQGGEKILKKLIPWWLKILLKIIIAKFSINYNFFKKIKVLQHGQMHDPKQALSTFNHHWQRIKREPGFVFLELGPGNSVSSGIIAKAYGAKKSFLVDAGKFASEDMKEYTRLINFLISNELFRIDTKKEFNNLEEVLRYFNIQYLTSGTFSLLEIENGCVDIAFSHVVLEHVAKTEVEIFVKELKRISAKDATQSHCVDLRDHLDNSLNNMRFSSEIWESKTFRNSGFYTNRIGCNNFLNIFKSVGFKVELISKSTWKKMPIPKESLNQEFRNLSINELLINEFEVVLKNN